MQKSNDVEGGKLFTSVNAFHVFRPIRKSFTSFPHMQIGDFQIMCQTASEPPMHIKSTRNVETKSNYKSKISLTHRFN